MRKLLLSLCLACSVQAALAQPAVVATFDTLYLPKADTFYVNYANPMMDVGFQDGLAHFPCYYDTSWGGLWSSGFAYSNMTDSLTGSWTNQYSAKTASGHNNSPNYVVFWQGYGTSNKVPFTGASAYYPQGFYITNTTYAYAAMRDGDFVSRKFGDTTGTGSGLAQGSYPDWFKLTVTGYRNGTISDTVEFYLADFRYANNAQDYILEDWTWVNLQKLSQVDSIDFALSSSDTGMFGMNTPAYFAMDNFEVSTAAVNVREVPRAFAAKIYPNPATDFLAVELVDKDIDGVTLTDITGKVWAALPANGKSLRIHIAYLAPGTYVLQLHKGGKRQSVRFVKY